MTEKKNDVLIALATYNEIENLPMLVEQLLATVPSADILVVDDNSPDGTGAWALNAMKNDARVNAIVRTNERGLGSAVIRALKYAVAEEYRLVVNMDADFSHPVKDVPRLLARFDDDESEGKRPIDVAIGSRYVPGGDTPDWILKRRIMSRAINAFARLTLGLKTHDNSGAFRCYRVETLKKMNFDQIVSSGYSFFEETLYRLKRIGAQFEEIPIVFVDRRRGSSKINRKEAIRAVSIMLKLGLLRLFSRK